MPETLVIIGKVVSMLVAPPEEIGARGPNHLYISGAPKRYDLTTYIRKQRYGSEFRTPCIL